MELEIRHLRALTAIDETGSLTQAARRLGMSQPALSGLLQRIERNIGGRLFFRAEYGCLPTPLGAEVLTEARVVLSGMTAIAERVQEWSRRGLPSAPLRVGGYCGFLHVEISRWLRDQPWCSGVSLQEDIDERISVDKVAIGALDLALVYRAPLSGLTQPPGVRSVVVHPEEPVFLALAHDHPLAALPAITLADMAEHPWVDEPPGTTRWGAYVAQVCRDHGVTLDQPHSTQCLATLLELIYAKLAIGPALATSRDRPGSIAIRPIVDHPLRQELRLYYRPGTVVAAHIEEIHHQVLATFHLRQGCNPAYDQWWHERGRSLALTG
ncbi:LysR family transcriptional regulator [Actinokineospora globicatena]|uniref:Small neutral protease regulatory protein n=1 Tax=Actinokineospora globicatena TaxID=103729 RepID=A0A9W6QQT2_9PSEU|nr:LysR family transcriptional regulator [Actinokineospora globicatena]MCP2306373.1 DNA-binding transcriptional regulator, LysR family [Actinokineospora globicatena]GLW81800.1 small neutral protease regulatory protein [Actinokineospora globicatena]GLW88594.1 small neutral protease regulatory protein [Actinokineospora globicatena]GLW95221.1 small neutral protease regulatory protein [Actinokineospora globicatena]